MGIADVYHIDHDDYDCNVSAQTPPHTWRNAEMMAKKRGSGAATHDHSGKLRGLRSFLQAFSEPVSSPWEATVMVWSRGSKLF